jgi:hypothetical protein
MRKYQYIIDKIEFSMRKRPTFAFSLHDLSIIVRSKKYFFKSKIEILCYILNKFASQENRKLQFV